MQWTAKLYSLSSEGTDSVLPADSYLARGAARVLAKAIENWLENGAGEIVRSDAAPHAHRVSWTKPAYNGKQLGVCVLCAGMFSRIASSPLK